MPAPLWTRPFLLAVLATTIVFGGLYVVVPALPPFAARLGASKAEVGMVVGVYSLAAMVARVLLGPRMDRHGRRPFLLGGLLVFAAGAGAYTLARTYGDLVWMRVAQGMGWGLGVTAMAALVADLAPPQRRGEAISYWGLAPTLAMALGPWAGGLLLSGHGPAAVFRLSALLGALACLVILPVREPRPTPPAGPGRGPFLPPGALLPSLVLLLSSFSYGALLAFLPVELADQPGRAGSFFSLYALAIFISRPVAGRLSDRHGRAAVIHPGLALGALGMAVMGASDHPFALAAAAILYGAGIGGASFPGLLALTVDRCPESARSAGLAVFLSLYDLAIAFGAALLGPVYERLGFLTMSLTAAAGVVLAQAVFMLGLRQEARRRRRAQKPIDPAPDRV